MTNGGIRLASLAAGILVASACGAYAQQAGGTDTDLTDVRGQSVMERQRPGYDAAGIRAGGFMIYPSASVTEAYNDNIFATSNNETDDFITTLAARVAVNSTWSRHELNLNAGLSQDFYADNNDEDRFDWNIGAGGTLDISSATALSGALSYAQRHEDRGDPSSPAAADEPIEYNLFTGNAALAQNFARLTATVGGEYRDYNYDDSTSVGGVPIDQDFRDREEFYERVRLAYNVSPDTNFFVEGQLDQREYDLQPPVVGITRDSDGWQVVVGSEFRLTNLAQGGVYAGYQERDYDEVTFGDTDGLTYGANVDWFVTPMTTVTFTADQSVQETTIGGSSGFDRQTLGVDVDHELMRNLILSGGLSYGNNDFNSSPREDDLLGASAGVLYLLNRNVDVGLRYTFEDRDSNVATADYTRNVVAITLTGKL
ncbi:MAG: outer membrane beta-barrel protein [Parvibaculum sp.]|uniref:outer membrane beta-barrel protein n=1 Tax=Parvibaculum sp. TaxID=2024848 RepID=UPI002ABCB3A7|nr:outer membrane beta-barrel protein [Parvibaculum sp.]MDZ4379871.1 outer membrane beta-barrel protein [Parvibaculum sp.]